MSLDIWLEVEETIVQGPKIVVRKDGSNVEMTLEEWNALHPDHPPVILEAHETNTVWNYNITHNLNEMADACGVYEFTWDCVDKGHTHARDVIEGVEAGLEKLLAAPSYYKQFNPPNGWGTYDGLVSFLRSFVAACKEYPDAIIRVWR